MCPVGFSPPANLKGENGGSWHIFFSPFTHEFLGFFYSREVRYFSAAAKEWREWLRKKQLKAYGICVFT